MEHFAHLHPRLIAFLAAGLYVGVITIVSAWFVGSDGVKE